MQLIKNRKFKPILIVSILIILSILSAYVIKLNSSIELVSANEFRKVLHSKPIKDLYIKDNYIFLESDKIYKTLIDGIDKKELLDSYPISSYTRSSSFLIKIAILILLSILFAIVILIRRNPSNPQIVNRIKDETLHQEAIKPQYHSDISFKNIVGISEVKEDLEEIIDFLKRPLKYQKLNIRMPKGILLVGPPGVGKTLIAKAISQEANVPFFYHSGANFVQIYAGMGAKRVKELFNVAKNSAPSIIFIDEIDSVGKKRDNLNSDEREATLNQLLVEMDGFSSNSGVIVIAATNRVDVLDSALLRPGRFDRRIFIDLPNLKEREQIINYYLDGKKHNLYSLEIAKITAGFSPAAIETLINEASLIAIKNSKDLIEFEDILKSKDRVIFGKKQLPLLSNEERVLQSLYQATKAVFASWCDFKFDRVRLLMPIDIDEDSIKSKSNLIKLIKIYLSGTIYLKKEYNDIFKIGKEDRKKVNYLVKELIENYTINEYLNRNDLIENLISEIEKEIIALKPTIINVAKELQDKEEISLYKIKEYINGIF